MKQFEATHDVFKTVLSFTEETAPDWLTSCNTVPGSTMDNRWFWNDHVLTLGVGGTVGTDFHIIRRVA